jgi:hypothetical protein
VHFDRCLCFESARLFRTPCARGHTQEYQTKVSRIHLFYIVCLRDILRCVNDVYDKKSHSNEAKQRTIGPVLLQ